MNAILALYPCFISIRSHFSQKQSISASASIQKGVFVFTLADDDIFVPEEKYKIILSVRCDTLIKPVASSSYTLLHLASSSDSVYSVTVVQDANELFLVISMHFYPQIILCSSLYLLSNFKSLALWPGFLRSAMITTQYKKILKIHYAEHIPCAWKIPFGESKRVILKCFKLPSTLGPACKAFNTCQKEAVSTHHHKFFQELTLMNTRIKCKQVAVSFKPDPCSITACTTQRSAVEMSVFTRTRSELLTKPFHLLFEEGRKIHFQRHGYFLPENHSLTAVCIASTPLLNSFEIQQEGMSGIQYFQLDGGQIFVTATKVKHMPEENHLWLLGESPCTTLPNGK